MAGLTFPTVSAHCALTSEEFQGGAPQDLLADLLAVEIAAKPGAVTVSALASDSTGKPFTTNVSLDTHGIATYAQAPGYHPKFTADALKNVSRTVRNCAAALDQPAAKSSLRQLARKLDAIGASRPKSKSSSAIVAE